MSRRAGYKITEATRAKMSAAQRGKYGKPAPPDTREYRAKQDRAFRRALAAAGARFEDVRWQS
jgi:hypothetical protein